MSAILCYVKVLLKRSIRDRIWSCRKDVSGLKHFYLTSLKHNVSITFLYYIYSSCNSHKKLVMDICRQQLPHMNKGVLVFFSSSLKCRPTSSSLVISINIKIFRWSITDRFVNVSLFLIVVADTFFLCSPTCPRTRMCRSYTHQEREPLHRPST